MRILIILLSYLLLTSCNVNGKQDVQVSDSIQTIKQDGESFTHIIVRLEYIDQIKKLCEEANPQNQFNSYELMRQAVAECTLSNIKLLGISVGQLVNFNNRYCDSDISNLTPEQVLEVIRACEIIRGL